MLQLFTCRESVTGFWRSKHEQLVRGKGVDCAKPKSRDLLQGGQVHIVLVKKSLELVGDGRPQHPQEKQKADDRAQQEKRRRHRNSKHPIPVTHVPHELMNRHA